MQICGDGVMSADNLYSAFGSCGCFETKTDTESKTVRVGWYPDSYHITGENGERSGYGYEYKRRYRN